MPVDPVEFGRVLGRLDAQDREIKGLRQDVTQLLELANRGKGSLSMLLCLGSVIGAVMGYFADRLFH